MNRQVVDDLLADKMLTVADLRAVAVDECGEPLVALRPMKGLRMRPIDPEMERMTGSFIYVRAGVADRLYVAAEMIAAERDGLELEIVYGYRTAEIQSRLFESFRGRYDSRLTSADEIEATHRLIAAPDVAGHPAGAAVDAQILEKDCAWDMGTAIWEFTPDSAVFSPFISRAAWSRRQWLRRIMMACGFAPFDGEWWHFSYGDREWAAFYDQPHAIYGPNAPPLR